MTIGEKIKNKRIELGWSQDELAKKCGYKSRSSINKIELARDLPLKRIETMAKVLDVSPGYLMGWEDADGATKETGDLLVQIRSSYQLRRLVKNFVRLSGIQQDNVIHLVESMVPPVEHP